MEPTRTSELGTLHGATLHAVRVKGLATADDVARISGVAEVAGVLIELVTAELATQCDGFYAVTPAGLACDSAAMRQRLGSNAGALGAAYDDRFLSVNVRFKRLATSWQEQGEQFELIEEAAEVHDEVVRFLDEAAAYAPHFGRYRERLGVLMDEFLSGEARVLTAARGPSYHNTWFELHEDLITTLGRTREKEVA